MRRNMFRTFLIAIGGLLVSGCSDEFRAGDYGVGPDGEPPKVLEPGLLEPGSESEVSPRFHAGTPS